MPSREIRWITALVAAGLLVGAALAQEQKPPEPAPDSQAPQTKEQVDDQRPDVKPVEKEEPGDAVTRPDLPQPGGDARKTGGENERTARGPAPTVSAADRTVVRKVLLEEAKYRKRLAQVGRLRELADKSGDEKRLAKLDDLEAKIKRLYEQRMARFRQKLGDDKFKFVNDRMRHGRQHPAGAAKGRPGTAGRAGEGRGGPKTKPGRKPSGEAEDEPPAGTAPKGKGRPGWQDTERDDRGRPPAGTKPKGKGPPQRQGKERDDRGRGKPKSEDS